MNNLPAFQKYTALSHHQVFLTHPPYLIQSCMWCVQPPSAEAACALQSTITRKSTCPQRLRWNSCSYLHRRTRLLALVQVVHLTVESTGSLSVLLWTCIQSFLLSPHTATRNFKSCQPQQLVTALEFKGKKRERERNQLLYKSNFKIFFFWWKLDCTLHFSIRKKKFCCMTGKRHCNAILIPGSRALSKSLKQLLHSSETRTVPLELVKMQ